MEIVDIDRLVAPSVSLLLRVSFRRTGRAREGAYAKLSLCSSFRA